MVLLTPHSRRARHRTALVTRSEGVPWLLIEVRWWDRFLVWLHSLDLDQALALGRPAEHDRLHALRAAVLVSPATRHVLADGWARVLARRDRPGARLTGRVPVQRARLRVAAEDVRSLVDALRRPGPVPVRGVALASVLLTDARGPLYDARSRVDLASAVRDATRLLDPGADVVP